MKTMVGFSRSQESMLRAGGVAQVIEHLPSKCKALSSSKKKKKYAERAASVLQSHILKLASSFVPKVLYCFFMSQRNILTEAVPSLPI
jgi:hypothetical protein